MTVFLQRSLRRACIIGAILILSGCLFEERHTLILATDQPEMAAYVEMFNAQQDQFKVELVYSLNPADAVASGRKDYDIIVSEGLASISYLSYFTPLDELFTEYGLDNESFYPESLRTGVFEEKQVLLPVSFTLPAILIRAGTVPQDAGGVLLPLDTMREECRQFNTGDTTRFPIMGFSPKWTEDFFYTIARIQNSRFRESTEGSVVWNNENLEKAIEYTREWTETINGGSPAENSFRETYLYDPGYKLVFSGRIRFFPLEYQKFLLVPADIRQDVDFLWLSDGRRIPVNEDMVFAGIVKNPGAKKGAFSFLAWLFSPTTQEKLLESAKFKRIRSFGIAGGFSSITQVNELVLPKYFPSITGRVPSPGQLDFPPTLPENWKRIKREVIIPYLRERNINERSGESLENRLLTWYTQQVP